MRIKHNGLTFETDSPQRYGLEPERLEQMLANGTIQARDGTVLADPERQRVVHRLLGTYDHLPRPGLLGQGQAERRWLVPDLWPWGTIPMLGGNPKAGKTTLVVDLAASLLIPGRRFLDHFEPVSLTLEERGRGIWLINAETPIEDFEEALGETGVREATIEDPDGDAHPAADLLALDHLEAIGGPGMFDLTQPDNYDLWANRFVECVTCDGTDDWPPAVVIVDGLTAILQAVGKGTDAYGQWYAAFRRLMHELEVPNALVVGHSTLAGGHLMGGVEAQAGPDGLWVYSSDDPDRPNAARRFSVVSRLGGKPMNPTRVVLTDEGRLSLTAPPPRPEPRDEAPAPSEDDDDARVLTDLRAAGARGVMTTDLTGRGAEGQYRRRALRRLIGSGAAVERSEGRGRRLWAKEFAPA